MMFANTNSNGGGGGATEAVKSVDEKKPEEAVAWATATDGAYSYAGPASRCDSNDYGYDQLNAFGKGGKGSHNCGAMDHWQRECLQPGSDKGKGKGAWGSGS